jgi:hypothetical protein
MAARTYSLRCETLPERHSVAPRGAVEDRQLGATALSNDGWSSSSDALSSSWIVGHGKAPP